MPSRPRVAFVWDFFGPIHHDRLEATARTLGDHADVLGIELCGGSDVYAWARPTISTVVTTTLFPGQTLDQLPTANLIRRLVQAVRKHRITHVFLCHYEKPGIFLTATALHMLRIPVFLLHISQFEDKPRRVLRELLKSAFLRPYRGALTSSTYSREYLRFLGFEKPIALGYSTLSYARLRTMAGEHVSAAVDRPFVCLSRFVAKKNLPHTIECYVEYVRRTRLAPRKLIMIGDGPEADTLRRQVRSAGVDRHVEFRGFLQTEDISKELAGAACLLLLSTEEQFGNVVLEAQALSVPVIISTACGARDLVRQYINGFIVEPNNVVGTARFMQLLTEDANVWMELSANASDTASRGDTIAFATGVQSLLASC